MVAGMKPFTTGPANPDIISNCYMGASMMLNEEAGLVGARAAIGGSFRHHLSPAGWGNVRPWIERQTIVCKFTSAACDGLGVSSIAGRGPVIPPPPPPLSAPDIYRDDVSRLRQLARDPPREVFR
ncbi:Hypp6308 [Branchiostoma lanceolatum]|uniref:Hypp6308 protein n=1 Tax=Branchiostoma lanceolatum TaxID=7740 RepID=A0A8J9YSX0_BRALA|nr:Hypp6308 [Branchiostoma lanceolatum]